MLFLTDTLTLAVANVLAFQNHVFFYKPSGFDPVHNDT